MKIYLLGQFQIYISGRALPESAIKGRKARGLLKLIALQRHFRLIRDQAMDVLWPELDPNAAASQLYKALHHIRRAFSLNVEDAADWIEITDELIRLTPPEGVVTDALLFEERARAGLKERTMPDLETAVSIYAGDLLPTDLYEPWTSLPREHYRQLYIDALITLASRYEERGELSEAAEMLRLVLEKDPVLESAHRGLMRIFARRGQTTRALRQFELCKELLRRELDLEPSPETSETYSHIRSRRSFAKTDQSALPATTPSPMHPIINRAAESAEIDRSLDQLAAGEPGAIIICGGVGMGKTRLVRELGLRSRRRHFRVFSGGAREGEGVAAYGPFVEIFEAVLREHPELQRHLPAQLGRLVPRFSSEGAPVPHADKLAAKGYLFAQVLRFFGQLAEGGPVVLILEDLHAADEGSVELLSYLIRYGREMPVLLAATLRDDVRSGPMIRSLNSNDAVKVLSIAPLTHEEHKSLLQQHSKNSDVAAEMADEIFRLSEGNPLFGLELLRYRSGNGQAPPSEEHSRLTDQPFLEVPGSLPPSLRYVVERQLEGLSPSAHQMLYLAAVIGRHVSYELLSSAWGDTLFTNEGPLFEPLEEVTRASLLEERGLDYFFGHALVREAIYDSISEARRRALHGLVARQIVAMSANADDQPVDQIAYHCVRAGDIKQGVHYLVLAGARAGQVYAHDDALERFGRALSLLRDIDDNWSRRVRLDVLQRVGDVYRACGKLEQSYDAYGEAVKLAEDLPLGNPDLVELHRKIALVAIFRTEMDRAQDHLEKAFELVGKDACARARLLIIKALYLWHFNRLDEAAELAHDALDIADAEGAPSEASQACEILAMTYLPLGQWERGLKYEKQRQLYGWSPDIVVATDAHLCLWEYHVSGDQPFEQARSFMQSVAEQASQLGDLRCVAVCHYALGTMHLWRGESSQAVEELDASLELNNRVGAPAGMAYALARKGVLHTMKGATEAGWQAVREGIVTAGQAAVRDHCLQRLYGVGIWNRLEAGDLINARMLVEKSVELLEESGPCAACALELYPWLAYFYLVSGDMARARECGQAVSELAAQTSNPIGRAVAAMIESNLLVVEGKEKEAERSRVEAFDQAQSAVTEATHSPVVHYLDRMVDQQAELRAV